MPRPYTREALSIACGEKCDDVAVVQSIVSSSEVEILTEKSSNHRARHARADTPEIKMMRTLNARARSRIKHHDLQ